MKIGFDAKRAFFNKTGLGNYSRTVIKSLSEQFPEDTYFLYSPKPVKQAFIERENIKIITPLTATAAAPASNSKTTPTVSPITSAIWRSFFVTNRLKSDGIDIYHGLSHELPFNIRKAKVPSVLTVHDLIFLRFPQYYPAFDRIMYKLKLKRSCANADRVIAISEQTKDDLVKFLNVPKSKITVIYQSCDEQFQKAVSEDEKVNIRLNYGLPAKYILNVGTIEERKNLLLLVKAIKLINPAKRLPLVVIGKKTSYFNTVQKFIKENKLEKDIIFLHDVSFYALPSIYQSASAFIYPSRFEGFGLPIVEALFSKVPVISSNSCGCLKEAGGPDTLYVDPDDEKELADKIIKVISDSGFATNMSENGLVYAQRFQYQIVTKNLMKVYSQLCQ
jgi:glycosyltransferase involved in cell wall biosynthesis